MEKMKVILTQEKANEDLFWVAQCLEHDLTAQGETVEGALIGIKEEISRQVIPRPVPGLDLFESIPKAPDYYWKMFDKSKLVVKPLIDGFLDFEIRMDA